MADIRHLTHSGYPNFVAEVQDELTLQAFLWGLHPSLLREYVTAPATVDLVPQQMLKVGRGSTAGKTPPVPSTFVLFVWFVCGLYAQLWCRALVDTGSTVSLIRKGLLSWTDNGTCRIATVTGETIRMARKKTCT